MSDKKFSYLINLTKKQLILFSTFFFLGISLVFLFGYLLGSVSQPSPEKSTIANQEKTYDELKVINNESEIIFDDNLASSEILKKDNPQNLQAPRKTPKQKSIQTSNPNNATKKLKKNISTEKNNQEKFYLQIIATSSKEKASTIRNAFQERSYPVFVLTQKKQDQELYIVRVGYYKNKENALRHLKVIREKSPYKKAFIKKTQS